MIPEFPSYERDVTAKALLILRQAQALGIKIATDGVDVIVLAPMRVPGDVRRWFETALHRHKAAVIDIIQAENGGGRS
jgi:hypothetical protein